MTTNPVKNTFTTRDLPTPAPISSRSVTVAGLKCLVYGLTELPASATEITVLYLLHPRLESQECMAPFAAHLIRAYYAYVNSSDSTSTTTQPRSNSRPTKGLIAVSFDARNHGTRKVDDLANQAWRQGNEKHAIDMFSSYAGTAIDTSQIMDYLPAYLFPARDSPKITSNIILGVSLGAHAGWHLLLSDPRVSAAIITIGCPDYLSLMSDRARLSKRKSYTGDKGKTFVGSEDFPTSFAQVVRRRDPVGRLWSRLAREHTWTDVGLKRRVEFRGGKMSQEQIRKMTPLMRRCLGRKRVLNLSGGADKMVPYKFVKPFVEWLGDATGEGGWFEEGGCVVENRVFEGVGHEVVPEMVREMERFVIETVRVGGASEAMREGWRGSRRRRGGSKL